MLIEPKKTISCAKGTLNVPMLTVKIKKQTGDIISAKLDVRLDTPEEIDYWQNGGILPMAWREEVRK